MKNDLIILTTMVIINILPIEIFSILDGTKYHSSYEGICRDEYE